jgi:hypothetical protein
LLSKKKWIKGGNHKEMSLEVIQMREIVPISTPDQSSRNEENIQTSITKRNLHHLPKSVAQGFQEVLNTLGGISPPDGINAVSENGESYATNTTTSREHSTEAISAGFKQGRPGGV